MTKKLDLALVSSYNYDLPSSLIASYPASPRESARLLVYNRANKEIIHSTFEQLFCFLPKDTGIILNDTKVIKARIFGNKQNGGSIEMLLNSPLNNDEFKVYIRGKIKEGSTLYFDNGLTATVLKLQDDGTRIVSFSCDGKKITTKKLYTILKKIGHTPLPPYIKRGDEKNDEKEYQSVFATNQGAVAAPTASLHFSSLMFDFMKSNFDIGYVTLHIGAGTFKSVETENINDHVMHEEFFNIPKLTKKLIDSDKKLLCVGTTSTRTIEYYKRTGSTSGECNLFLNPNNLPLRTDFLLTNFHLPKSTLIMLVASFIGLEQTSRVYKSAIKKKYRFFSYGDAMLIL